jgi:alanine racemase
MKGITPSFVDDILGDRSCLCTEQLVINNVTIDSRLTKTKGQGLFFALAGTMRDGHAFLEDAKGKGCKNFVISDPGHLDRLSDTNVWVVPDTLLALQELSKAYRKAFHIRAVAITGSNGKTTVKEWLAHFLSFEYPVCKSPGSYNSQIGVPLSMFEIREDSEIGIFEAGLSKVGEMGRLEAIIQPDIGVFTNIGEAHSGGFPNRKKKISEKLLLFKNVKHLILCRDHEEIYEVLHELGWTDKVRSWGRGEGANLFRVTALERADNTTFITIEYERSSFHIQVQLTDNGSIENLFHCLAAMLVMGIAIERAIFLSQGIFQIPMRLEMVHGAYNNTIINDAYNHDLTSLRNALEFLKEQSGDKTKVVILSDIYESRMPKSKLEKEIQIMISHAAVDRVFWLGNQCTSMADKIFSNKADLMQYLETEFISDACILIKGARKHQLDEVKTIFQNQNHTSTLTIDLAAFNHNLQRYAKQLDHGVNMIAVIKAGAYGSGSAELARILQNRAVSYLAVAFCDEAIALRKAGITMPIMILNAEPSCYPYLGKYKLEPVIYSLNQLKQYVGFCKRFQRKAPIHIKLDSGMSRLGFVREEIEECGKRIAAAKLEVKTIFSHLAGSENKAEDANTHRQVQVYLKLYHELCNYIGANPKRHILNTGGIVRFHEYQFELVRIGLGMYGIDTTNLIRSELEKVHSFHAKVIQVKLVKSGTRIGYNQKGIVHRDSKIAIVNVGYADGLPRQVGLGRYALMYEGKKCPIIGQVCMDLTIIDITDCPDCTAGSTVEIFGKNNPIEKLAEQAQTIPYEILSGISGRVTKKWVMD